MLFSTSEYRAKLVAALLAGTAFLAVSACGGTSAGGAGATSSSIEGTNEEMSSFAGGVFFPQWQGPIPGVGINGRLFEDEADCIRVKISENFTEEGTTPTVLWPMPWAARRGEDGRVRILGGKGRVLAQVGDKVWLGGYPSLGRPLEEAARVDERTKRELRSRCPGEYYFAGDLEPPVPVREETTPSR